MGSRAEDLVAGRRMEGSREEGEGMRVEEGREGRDKERECDSIWRGRE